MISSISCLSQLDQTEEGIFLVGLIKRSAMKFSIGIPVCLLGAVTTTSVTVGTTVLGRSVRKRALPSHVLISYDWFKMPLLANESTGTTAPRSSKSDKTDWPSKSLVKTARSKLSIDGETVKSNPVIAVSETYNRDAVEKISRGRRLNIFQGDIVDHDAPRVPPLSKLPPLEPSVPPSTASITSTHASKTRRWSSSG